MEIHGDSLLGVPLLAISGDVDHSTAADLDRAVQENLRPDNQRLLVDLTSCRYIDSGGLAVFLYLARRLRSQGWLGVIGANRNVHRLFEIVGLMQEPGLRMFSRREEAAALIGAAGVTDQPAGNKDMKTHASR
jgi:anti-anti-sigma factor